MSRNLTLSNYFSPTENVVVYPGNCLEFLKTVPDQTFHLIVTSPPYNIGKEYEKKINIQSYVLQQSQVIQECVRVLADSGSLCWQVGNYVEDGAIIPLDTLLYPVFSNLGLKMRNRIIWNFEHGLHCSKRFSGRYETIIWFTKTKNYYFNLDPVRIPQKYPGKNISKVRRPGNIPAIRWGKTQATYG